MTWCRIHAISSQILLTWSIGVLKKLFDDKIVRQCYSKRTVQRGYCSETLTPTKMRVLNVAEKNDAAKSIADLMSRGGYRKREGFSRFNKIYEYNYNIFGQNCTMTMTSVSGHLLNYEFVGMYKKWNGCNPVALFDAPVQKFCPDDYKDIKRTLEREIRGCSTLVIWTDGDREGENIGFEIIQVCKAVKPNIRVLRARFSEITPRAIDQACRNLAPPDQNINDAVDVRTELDLRIGAAFTRFQTLRLQKVFPNVLGEQLISYGSCQFPTLGFVVERYKQVEAFIPEPFWKIRVTHKVEEGLAEFNWKRVKLFDHTAVLALYMHCLETPIATVVDVRSKSKSKWRPTALDTVELEKLASRKLRISAKETMKIAEKLYTSGFISYPRTETNIFPEDFNLPGLVQNQVQDPNWGAFAARVLEQGPNPRNGKKSDQAHPPIHPTKYTNNLHGNEAKVYEFIVRHFLACLSQDAQGMETTIEIDVAEEKFTVAGLMIIARNYLDVYPYDRWNAKIIPVMQTGQQFMPTAIEMNQGETSAPALLTEADLIALMEKHGIGTDATHADHIETIKSRVYVGLENDRFVPGELGIGLVDGYNKMGYQMSKPNLRAELENDLKLICEGRRNKDAVLQEQIRKYREVFVEALNQASKLDEALSQYFGDAQTVRSAEILPQVSFPVMPCPVCRQDMILRAKRDNKGFFLSCMGFPDCKTAIWFPDGVLSAEVTEHICETCKPGPVHKLRLKFKRGSVLPSIPLDCIGCIAGCDPDFAELFRLSLPAGGQGPTSGNQARSNTGNNRNNTGNPARPNSGNQRPNNNDSGYGSSFGSANSSRGGSQNNSRSFLGQNNNLGGPNSRPSNNQNRLTNNTRFPAPKPPTNTNSNSYHTNANNFFGSNTTNQNVGSKVNSGGQASNQGFGSNTSNRGGPTYNQGGRMPFTPISMNNNGSGNSSGDGDAIVCNCGEDARSLTVRKDGPNQGRQFYGCAKPKEASCGFFLWADDQHQDTKNKNDYGNDSSTTNYGSNSNTSAWTNTGYQPPRPGGDSDGGGVKCQCGLDATSRTVQKDGPNKGRQFHCCSKPMGDQCRFFEWVDENTGGGGGFGGNNLPGPGRGGGAAGRGIKRKTSTTAQPGTRKKRSCGLCGEEGHTRKTCRQKDD
ncbi:DNA topoisomerase 3-alpha-like [Lineus longissimus]|uniref:DNA topoisomerase 3-alpha-like n=1 Tax=Lineus longissimus TaxID=88925 RepID=UPI002B4D34A2